MKKLLDGIGWMVIIAIVFTSCSTLKKSQKDLNFVQVNHPELLTDYCAVTYPIKENTKYIKGKDSLVRDTSRIFINCDSAAKSFAKEHPNATPEEKKVAAQKVFVPFPLHDTVFRTDTLYVTKENTAQIASLQTQNGKIQAQLDDWKAKAQNRSKWIWRLIIALGLCVGWIFKKPIWGLITKIG